jgi:cytochrome d ubiquinol oxidase subunit I
MGRGYAMGLAAHVLAASPLPARSQMAASLGFHIILACFGIAFPAVTLIAHWIGIKRCHASALLHSRPRTNHMSLLVAVGAESGTVLS